MSNTANTSGRAKRERELVEHQRAQQVEHKKAVDDYLKRLRAFLATPNQGDGGWPTISADELVVGRDLAQELFDLKWGRDCDGDSPMQMVLVDRKKYHLPWYYPIRRVDEALGESDKERQLLESLRLVQCGQESFAKAGEQIQRQLYDITARRQGRANAFPIYLRTYKATGDWLEGEHKFDRPVSIHLEEDAALAFVPPEGFTSNAPGRDVVKMLAVPGPDEDHRDGYKSYRDKVAACCDQVVPRYGRIEPLGIERFTR